MTLEEKLAFVDTITTKKALRVGYKSIYYRENIW